MSKHTVVKINLPTASYLEKQFARVLLSMSPAEQTRLGITGELFVNEITYCSDGISFDGVIVHGDDSIIVDSTLTIYCIDASEYSGTTAEFICERYRPSIDNPTVVKCMTNRA